MELTPKACGDKTGRKKTLNHTAGKGLEIWIRSFKDEADYKATHSLHRKEKSPDSLLLKKRNSIWAGRYTSDYMYGI